MRPHAEAVIRGEYALPPGYEIDSNPPLVVLDIGANVGAFAWYAFTRWPGCKIHCYEPVPQNADVLRRNVYSFEDIQVHEVAVCLQGQAQLYAGNNNCGEYSRHDLGEQRFDVSVIAGTLSPLDLPRCDVLKIDTEGDERDIVRNYPYLRTCTAVLLEWHRATDRWYIGAMLDGAGFELVRE